jgi:hypothetical protein
MFVAVTAPMLGAGGDRMRGYDNFDLLFTRRDRREYEVRVVESPVGDTGPVGFTVPFSDTELNRFLSIAGRSRDQIRHLGEWSDLTPQDFGSRLYAAVFRGDVSRFLERNRTMAEGSDRALRIRLRLSETPELATLPWELLYEDASDQFLAMSGESVVRYLQRRFVLPPAPHPAQLRVLVVAAEAAGFPILQVEREWENVRAAVEDSVHSGRIALDRLCRRRCRNSSASCTITPCTSCTSSATVASVRGPPREC